MHEQIPDMMLDIYGTGRLESELRQQIQEKGLETCVSLRGWTSSPLVEHSNSDIYVLTSDYEGMPNALMEALAMGLPCISTDCDTGPEDLITDGENGFLIDLQQLFYVSTTKDRSPACLFCWQRIRFSLCLNYVMHCYRGMSQACQVSKLLFLIR